MEKGIISREPIIKCKKINITPIVVLIDDVLMGYINNYKWEGEVLIVNRTIPRSNGKGIENITQKIIKN